MTEDQRKHLEFIQSIVNRMSANSFMVKGWAVTIVSALLAVAASLNNFYFIIISIPSIIVFYAIDAYYLQQEKKFRSLYNEVVRGNTEIKIFEIDVSKAIIANNPDNGFKVVLRSKAVYPFYLLLGMTAIVLAVVASNTKSNKSDGGISIRDTLNFRNVGKDNNLRINIDTVKVFIIDTLRANQVNRNRTGAPH